MGALVAGGLRRGGRDVRARCSPSARARRCAAGLILVDTKYEIGRRPDGTLCFIDEIHTPDSSRYWYADDYEARFAKGEEPRGLDKEYVRRTLADQGYTGDGPPPQADRRRPRRGGAPLHPGLRAGHRPAVRARHRRADRPHPQEPEARVGAFGAASASARFVTEGRGGRSLPRRSARATPGPGPRRAAGRREQLDQRPEGAAHAPRAPDRSRRGSSASACAI